MLLWLVVWFVWLVVAVSCVWVACMMFAFYGFGGFVLVCWLCLFIGLRVVNSVGMAISLVMNA